MGVAGDVALPTKAIGRTWAQRIPALTFPQKLIVAFALAIGVPLFTYALAVHALNHSRLRLMDEAALEQRITIMEQHIRAAGLTALYHATTAASQGPEGFVVPGECAARLQDLSAAHHLEAACVTYPGGKRAPVVLGHDLILDAAIGASAYASAAAAGHPTWGLIALRDYLAVVAAAPAASVPGHQGRAPVLIIADKLDHHGLTKLLGSGACTASVRPAGPSDAGAYPAIHNRPLQRRGRDGFEHRILQMDNTPDGLRASVVLHSHATGTGPVLLTIGMSRSALPGRGPRFVTVAFCTLACAMLLAALLTSIIGAWVSRPLDDLRVRVEAVAQGRNGHPPLQVTTNDALGRVASALNHMVASLDDAQRKALHNERLAIAGKMATTVAHEVRNVLSPIQLRAEILLQGVQDPVARDNLLGMRDEVNCGGALLQGLLEFASKGPSEFRPVQISDVIARAADLVLPQFRKSGVGLFVLNEASEALVLGDRAQLLQLLVNLLNNAGESRARNITLAADATDSEVHIVVRDDGVGMDAETRDRALDPFFTTKPSGQGTGLGLSICHSVVKAHSGSLSIDSTKNAGTRVGVHLPLVGAHPCPFESWQ